MHTLGVYVIQSITYSFLVVCTINSLAGIRSSRSFSVTDGFIRKTIPIPIPRQVPALDSFSRVKDNQIHCSYLRICVPDFMLTIAIIVKDSERSTKRRAQSRQRYFLRSCPAPLLLPFLSSSQLPFLVVCAINSLVGIRS